MTIKVGDKVIVKGYGDSERDVLYIHQAPGDSRVFYVTAYKGDIPKSYTEQNLTKVEPVSSLWYNVYPSGPAQPHKSRKQADIVATKRLAVLRVDTCNGVSTAHLEGV